MTNELEKSNKDLEDVKKFTVAVAKFEVLRNLLYKHMAIITKADLDLIAASKNRDEAIDIYEESLTKAQNREWIDGESKPVIPKIRHQTKGAYGDAYYEKVTPKGYTFMYVWDNKVIFLDRHYKDVLGYASILADLIGVPGDRNIFSQAKVKVYEKTKNLFGNPEHFGLSL